VPSTRLAIQQAITHDVVVVVAAGNGGRDVGLNDNGNPYPASGSILVGATDFDPLVNPRTASSNFGPRITVSAPGYEISDITCGTQATDHYRVRFGFTSGATPKVAAACALMLEVNDSLTHDEIKSILTATGSAVQTMPSTPAGVFLDVHAAVKAAKNH
jgi:subtilisin family serine protease